MPNKANRKQRALNKQLTFEQYDHEIQRLAVQKSLAIEKAYYSEDPNQIIKAQAYVSKLNASNKKQPDIKSWLFMPEEYGYTGSGYKEALKGVTFENLKSISKLFIIRLIHDTRIDQVKNYLHFSSDDQKEGFTIVRKRGIFDNDNVEVNRNDKKKIAEIVKFLEEGGENSKWDNYDDFQEFISKILRDSLTYDQCAFETVRARNGDLKKYIAVDASMIRHLDSQDPRYSEQFKGMEWNGFLPKYCMAWQSQILKNPVSGNSIIYYPWELGYGVRNKISDNRSNGYGVGELEIGIELVTWILWSFQYNANFFRQGSQPKGFINIKGEGGGDNTVLNEFRNNWRQMMSGVGNSHKIPVFEGIDLEWTDLQMKNRDMEFNQWVEFLLVVFCSLYRIDPSELGFNFKQQTQMFGQQGQKERLDHSQKKGLKPLLVFLQKLINKYIVSELDENYEFKFTGVDIEDEESQVKLDDEKLKAGMVSFESMFEKYMGRKYDPKKDTILNQVFQSAQQMKQYGGEGMNSMVDEQTGEPDAGVQNPFEQFAKSQESDPIMKESLNYIQSILG